MAEALLNQLVHEAGMDAKAGIHRQYLIASILAFREKLPHATDYRAWKKEYANSSPALERLDYVFGSMLHGKSLNEEEAHEWAFEGLTTFPRTDIGDRLRDMFKGISRSLLLVPVRCAMWD